MEVLPCLLLVHLRAKPLLADLILRDLSAHDLVALLLTCKGFQIVITQFLKRVFSVSPILKVSVTNNLHFCELVWLVVD